MCVSFPFESLKVFDNDNQSHLNVLNEPDFCSGLQLKFFPESIKKLDRFTKI
jgi:hypothetical protein